MIETASRSGRRREWFSPGRGERSSLLHSTDSRFDRETEASVNLAATLPPALCDHDGATTSAAPAAQIRTDAETVVHDIYCRLAERLPGRIRDLRVERALGSVLEISGVATSYYVKQVAQHIAMDVARLQRVINRIEVRVPR
ncbi:MAG: hypothetical protein KF688_13985 [Pirellulales bacterium]|nr:hypothetical protein [Pirellulales bacterium]MBX3435113.1 hypothetical protein [Pirellulales bacterium]